MNEKFLAPKVNEIDQEVISLDCVKEQLKSMQLGYIAHCFIVRGLSEDFEIFNKANFEDVDEKTKEKAEEHALKHLEDPNYLSGEVMKTIPNDVQQCVQAMLMMNNKRSELESQAEKTVVMKRNIIWLKELIKKMEDKKE